LSAKELVVIESGFHAFDQPLATDSSNFGIPEGFGRFLELALVVTKSALIATGWDIREQLRELRCFDLRSLNIRFIINIKDWILKTVTDGVVEYQVFKDSLPKFICSTSTSKSSAGFWSEKRL
jgi:hypothetical protein